MEAKWLEDFLSLIDTRSFSLAARKRNVTQSAFSRRIQALEAWMGAKLVNRDVSPLTLTPAGTLFRSYAAEILRNVYAARTLVGGQADTLDKTGFVKFAVAHTLMLSFFPAWLRRMGARSRHVVAQVEAVNVPEGVVSLVEGRCDLLLAYHHAQLPILLDTARFPFVTLGTERIRPYSTPDAQGRPLFALPGDARQRLPYMAYASGAFLGNVVEMLLLNAPQAPVMWRAFETHMSEALKAMVVAGHGIGWLPEGCVEREAASGEVVMAGSDAWSTALEIRLYRSAESTSDAARALWETARAELATGSTPRQ